MLEYLRIRNFTAFAEAEFNFSPGLNIIVGTNGTGKSHVLKLGYTVSRTSAFMIANELLAYDIHSWQNQLATGLKEVFQPEELGKLVRRGARRSSAAIQVEFRKGANTPSAKVDFTFAASAKQPVASGKQPVTVVGFPTESELEATELSSPVFIPPKEVLTMSWMLAQYELRKIPLDVTYPQLIRLLNQAPLRKIVPAATKALAELERLLGGKVEEEGGKFYLLPSKGERQEMNLVAEGIRKFGMLEKLLRNGSLGPYTTLYWDEPESNLNPALLRKLASLLAGLAKAGFQIILATHSLFLLKQFHILSKKKEHQVLPIRYFGLNAATEGPTTVATQGDFELLPNIVALDEELEQADELTLIFAQDDAHHN